MGFWGASRLARPRLLRPSHSSAPYASVGGGELRIDAIAVAQVVGFGFGYMAQDFGLTVKFWAAGMALACAVALPDWPFFRANPVKWLPAQDGDAAQPLVDPAVALRKRRGRKA